MFLWSLRSNGRHWKSIRRPAAAQFATGVPSAIRRAAPSQQGGSGYARFPDRGEISRVGGRRIRYESGLILRRRHDFRNIRATGRRLGRERKLPLLTVEKQARRLPEAGMNIVVLLTASGKKF
jgi:hypothetical protein